MADKTKRMKHCVVPRFEAKEKDGKLYIEGYASVFNEIDHDGDIVLPGAFAKTINERVAAGRVSLMARHFAHGGDVLETVGTIIEAKEDEIGLWTRSELDDTQLAQETHAKIKSNGNRFGMSIGGQWIGPDPRRNDEGDQIGLLIKEVALYEVTITLMPSCEGTMGTVEAKRTDTEHTEDEDAGATETPAATPSFKAELRRQERVLALLRLRR